MLLNSLIKYYENRALLSDSLAPPSGWMNVTVKYAININEDGKLLNIIPLSTLKEVTDKKGKIKSIESLPSISVPAQKTRTSGKYAYLLCDNGKYLLGCPANFNVYLKSPELLNNIRDSKDYKESLLCYNKAAERHLSTFEKGISPATKAVRQFFRTWNPENLLANIDYFKNYPDLDKSNMVFVLNIKNHVLAETEVISICNQATALELNDNKSIGVSLITGRRGPIALVHGKIKNVNGANASGASLISSNSGAFNSYGKVQGENSPITEEDNLAYCNALNMLLSKNCPHNHQTLGNITLVYWSEMATPGYSEFFQILLNGDSPSEISDTDIEAIVEDIKAGRKPDYKKDELSPESVFCILGITPNNARLSIRFFYRNSFGKFIGNLEQHYQRMSIVGLEKIPYPYNVFLSLVRDKKDKIPDIIASEYFMALINNTMYPAQLIQLVMQRIRAEQKITAIRAGIIKAYWLRNGNLPEREEVFTVALNDSSNYQPYILGRTFAVLERIQYLAIKKETIKERYFNSACSTPSVMFPQLLRLSNAHMAVLKRDNTGAAVVHEKLLTELLGRNEDGVFPSHLSLQEQGAFILGYYHQRQNFFK